MTYLDARQCLFGEIINRTSWKEREVVASQKGIISVVEAGAGLIDISARCPLSFPIPHLARTPRTQRLLVSMSGRVAKAVRVKTGCQVC